ncbi:unnamed protein product [Allacma fusca]|uniref:Peptidylprolyl isomerase n=1 Tax=Allacma fusca TaxID=39272 RepID=A0A8J2LRQ5_9HEXA|nr:unnamed protein product [Allacma fusca]
MCVGEKRTIIVPKHLVVARPGYEFLAPSGYDLLYHIELLEIDKNVPNKEEFFKEIDSNFDKKLSRDEVKFYLQKHFEMTDTNGNVLDDNEVDPKLISERDDLLEQFFEKEDRNGDGLIEYKEMFIPRHNEF